MEVTLLQPQGLRIPVKIPNFNEDVNFKMAGKLMVDDNPHLMMINDSEIKCMCMHKLS